jgi:solute:Na+ symporter, SSS family
VTTLLMTVIGFFFAYAIYIAARSSRLAADPADFLDAGGKIPSWGFIFAGTGVMLAGLGLSDHFLLTAAYGLQYSHVALGLVVAALCSALVQKRIWLAARISGSRTIGDLMGDYFGSTTIRLYLLAVLFLFSVPLSAFYLTQIGALIQAASGGALPSSLAIPTIAFFLFLFSAIGGWWGVIYVVAAQSLLLLVLIAFSGGFASAAFDELALVSEGIRAAEGIFPDRIPGVVQFTDGIGKELPIGGLWTTVAILSFALSLTGVVLSPGFSFLGITTAAKKTFAFSQVWMIAGIAAGLLLLVAPLIGAEVSASGQPGFTGYIDRLAATDQLVTVGFVLMLLAALQIGIAFFAASGASIVTLELVSRFILPDLPGAGQKLAAQIALAAIYLAIATAASYAPLGTAIFSSLALPLSAQLLPAFLGLAWLPWISRSGVIAGLVFGALLVLFTEPFGLILFEGLFLDLPWGRWPLTVHSAAWGLFFNLGACLLVSTFTRGGEERDRRQRLHDAFARDDRVGGKAARSAKWSLMLLWLFFAMGPGAILGNDFFSRPIFTGTDVSLGVPSLLVWQLLFWIGGVPLVWWLAYPGRMSVIEVEPAQTLTLEEKKNPLFGPTTTPWIARLLKRVAER